MSWRLPIGVATTYKIPYPLLMVFPVRLTAFFILGVTSCQITPPESIEKDQYSLPSNLELQIRQAAKATNSAETVRIFVSAARLLSTQNATERSKSIIARIKSDPSLFSYLSPSDRFEVELVDLELDYRDANPRYKSDLLKRLEVLVPTSVAQEISGLELAARIRISMEDHVGFVRTLVTLSSYQGGNGEELSVRIWSSIKKVPLGYAATLAANADTEDEFAWWDLAAKFLSPLTPTLQQRGWDSWRAENPSHLANKHPPSEISIRSKEPATVALLLPQSGPLAEAARAIRDGFIAAYWSTQVTGEIEGIRLKKILVYDTSGNRMADIVSRAQADGAQILLGPLSKSNVHSMITLKTAIPVIAFNRISPTLLQRQIRTDAFYRRIPQLSLAVEDEAVELANRISSQGLTRIIVFRGDTSWSDRAYIAFTNSVPSSVKLVSITTFANLKDVTSEVGRALDIDESIARYTNVERLVKREIKFTPRRRNDLHAAVGFIGPREYESLAAALDFHFGSDIPLYVTSAALRSDVPIKKKSGTQFIALPLTLFSFPLKYDVESAFPAAKQTPSFYALGIDAFRLANRFELLLAGVSIPATTGNLVLSRNGFILRTPAWGRIRNNLRLARQLSIGD